MKVIYAVLKTNEMIHHPAFGKTMQKTLNQQGYKGLVMSLHSHGLRIDYKGISIVVPMEKFDLVQLGEDVTEMLSNPFSSIGAKKNAKAVAQ